MEEELHLKNLNLYDGKNYWHYPSNKWEPVEAKINELMDKAAELNKARITLEFKIEKYQLVIKEQNIELKRILKDNAYLHSLFSVRMRSFFKSLIMRK